MQKYTLKFWFLRFFIYYCIVAQFFNILKQRGSQIQVSGSQRQAEIKGCRKPFDFFDKGVIKIRYNLRSIIQQIIYSKTKVQFNFNHSLEKQVYCKRKDSNRVFAVVGLLLLNGCQIPKDKCQAWRKEKFYVECLVRMN